MNDVYLWCVAGVTSLVALNTLFRLWTEQDRLSKEDLTEDDRAFVFRVTVFLVFPLLTLLDLRATILCCELAGGYIKNWSYGLLWYHALPAGLPEQLVIPVLFSGAAVSSVFVLLMIPALLCRPHPFLATLIGYTTAFLLGLNFIADPLLSIFGLGGLRWQIAFTSGSPEQRVPLVIVHVVLAALYLMVMRSSQVAFWFSQLTRPVAADELNEALGKLTLSPPSARMACKVGLLYRRAGLHRQAAAQLRKIQTEFPHCLYGSFLESVMQYGRREYKTARRSFLYTSDCPGVDGELKASLLAAAACSAFADGDLIGALNLSERALEFEDACLVARMVKVDVFLRQGKKEHAGEEILLAMHMGLTLDLENNVPLDIDRTFDSLVRLEERQRLQVWQPTSRI